MEGPIDNPIPVSPLGPLGEGADVVGGWCPSCGGEFRLGFTRCGSCGVDLDVEPPPQPELEPETAPDGDRHDVVEYDLNDWTTEQRTEIDEQLSISDVPHEWSHGVLRVPGAHEALADELVDVIDEADDLAFPGRVDAEVEYEFPEWSPDQRDELVARLQEADIPFGWDGLGLAVREVDEAAVDAIVVAIDPEFPV